MERSEILAAMGTLKLHGMKGAYDEVMARAVKRQHEPQRVVGDLLSAEIAEKQARSIKYEMTIARLPLAKDLEELVFDGSPINEALVRELISRRTLRNFRMEAARQSAMAVGGATHIQCRISCLLKYKFDASSRFDFRFARHSGGESVTDKLVRGEPKPRREANVAVL